MVKGKRYSCEWWWGPQTRIPNDGHQHGECLPTVEISPGQVKMEEQMDVSSSTDAAKSREERD